ncbi:conserved hypothetical protein [Flavobacterium sp. 9R]|uniref:hypothetical protein n=1 Tax=Flavobacterium sp. 9R TaxID=2653143 RepID=UPI0012F1FF0F|nr:hypothetical protein [Flavobacterium sp. 9R]VXB58033.1 conserved hypothetical protein [Flavobacterium sp. 9R]
MTSKLSLSEFRNRIKENLDIGSLKLKLSPLSVFTMFGETSKPFYGNYDETSFRLTANSTITPTFYILKGKYKKVNATVTVNYNIVSPSKFHKIWIKFFPILACIAVNSVFFFDSTKAPIEVYVVFNSFWIVSSLFSVWYNKRKKRKLEEKFLELFEITKEYSE